MGRAEKAALEAYPYDGGTKGLKCEQSILIYIRGYRQAEKDTIEKAAEWWYEHLVGFFKEGLSESIIQEFKKAMEE